MADAGMRIQVEGEKEFKAALAQIDVAVKNNNKSLKLLTQEYNLQGEEIKKLTDTEAGLKEQGAILASKNRVLTDSIAEQTQKVDLLDVAVKQASEKYAENDKRLMQLRGQLLDASNALRTMEMQQIKNNEAIEANKAAQLDAQHSTAQYEQAVEALSASVAANDAEIKRLTESGKNLDAENQGLGRSSEDLAKKTENLQKKNADLAAANDKLRDSIAKQREITENLAKAQATTVQRYGEGSKEAEAYRKRLADATAQLDKMEAELKQNKTAIEENNAAIEAGADAPSGMLEGLKEIADLTGIKIPAGIEKMIGGEASGFLGAAAATTGIVGGLATVLKKLEDIWQETISWAQDVSTKAAELDLNTEEYQEFEYIAKSIGIDVGVFESALSKLKTKAGETVTKNAELREEIEKQGKAYETARHEMEEWASLYAISDSFKAEYEAARKEFEDTEKQFMKLTEELDSANEYWDNLGISIQDSSGKIKSSKELLLEVVDALGEQDNELEKAAQGQKIFGESWFKLNPVIGEGSQRLRELAKEAYDVGAIIKEGDVATQNAAKNAQDALGQRWTTTVRNAASEFKTSSSIISGAIAGIKTVAEGALGIIRDLFGANKQVYSNTIPPKVSTHNGYSGIGSSFANGTDFAPGGLALVGERGPEIVSLPRGSAVYPHGTAPAGMSSTANTYNITIDAKNIREFNDIVRYAQGARVAMRRG